MKVQSVALNNKVSFKIPKDRLSLNKLNDNSVKKSIDSVKTSKGFQLSNDQKSDIIIREIPIISKNINNIIESNESTLSNNFQIINENNAEKKTSLQKLKEIAFYDDSQSDNELMTSVSFKKESNLNYQKTKKKTKKQLLEEKMLEVDDNEIRSIVRELENKIDREIEEELQNEANLKQNPDKIRADKVLETDDLIKRAYDNGLITIQEIILFIEYYEILANINSKKNNVISILGNISAECPLIKEKDYWNSLREGIENSFQIKDAVLDIASQSKNDITNQTILSDNKPEEINKSVHEQVIVTQKFGSKLISFKNKYNSVQNIQDNSLRSSQSSIQSDFNKLKVPKNFDLHDDIQLNHLHVNQTAKKIAISKDFKSKNKSLFKFQPKIKEDDEDLKNKFIDLLELPNKVIDNMKIPENKKSFVKSKIFDALNYVKEKKLQLKSKK